MKKSVDGNMAVSLVMHKVTEFASIYPITPSSPMAENYEKFSSDGKTNIYGTIPKCLEMQSEAGVAGTLHGALLTGAIGTTFTSSQGLLLMIPNMYKIAGELLPCVINVSARSLATHALNIFGDHSDVMACRETGFAFLCASTVQEAHDFALISFVASYNSSVPFLHFFDGFRTSHEIAKIDLIDDEIIKKLVPMDKIKEFKDRALNPNSPVCKGTNQNPDVFFQNREACQVNYNNVLSCLQKAMDDFYGLTNRRYNLFDYVGPKDAKYVIVSMGSSCESIEEYIEDGKGSVGLIKVRAFRPFDMNAFINALPKSVEKICVLDRVKDSTANLDPLASEIASVIATNNLKMELICGRYGLGGKDLSLGMIKAICENLTKKSSKNHFLIGINDDVLNRSLDFADVKENNHYCALFYGLGSDGTVSANKNTIKIIGDNTNLDVQGYFEYDSKKSGSMTISHLRIGERKIKSHYLINNANLIAVHNFNFVSKIKIADKIKAGGTILLNCPYSESDLLAKMPKDLLTCIVANDIKVYYINANQCALDLGLGNKINIIMQAGFFAVFDKISKDIAKEQMIKAVKTTYASKGEQVVNANISAINVGFNELKCLKCDKISEFLSKNSKNCEVLVKKCESTTINNEYYEKFVKPILSGNGNSLGVSSFDKGGTVLTGTTKFEKRKIAEKLPKWIPQNCIECNMCAISCPHGCIRPKVFDKDTEVPFESIAFNRDKSLNFKMQVKPCDCTGCGVCASVCPAKQKALEMVNANEIFDKEVENDEFIEKLPKLKNTLNKFTIAGSQFEPTLFEFSGACAGCGETPYIKLLTQLFGDKLIIANATGCSSIYGASCPTCPYTTNDEGKGPVFANSLFEDNAEFGLGLLMGSKINNKDNSVWIVGGDGWAYDIGFGGLDHVLANGENINILVLDTEVYSNTGGQMSKSTPRGSAVKFASNGKMTAKKRLSAIALTYGNVYVAQIALGANMQQAINAFKEAQEYEGVSLIIAYCPCINHGIDMSKSSLEMKNAVASGYFDLFRYNPNNEKPLTIDSRVTASYEEFANSENRYKLLKRIDEKLSEKELNLAKQDSERFRAFLNSLKEND